MPTKEPVTVSGWYENTDGTWTYYYYWSLAGALRERCTVAAGESRPTYAEMLQADAAEQRERGKRS